MRVGLEGQVESSVNGGSTVSPRLLHAAQEFEAQMMKELMKPMTSEGSLPGDETDSGASGAMGEFASEALAQAISRQGGFGVAKCIVQRISQSGTASTNGLGTTNLK
jgi:peptidoglycan hydrolase FlgJ